MIRFDDVIDHYEHDQAVGHIEIGMEATIVVCALAATFSWYTIALLSIPFTGILVGTLIELVQHTYRSYMKKEQNDLRHAVLDVLVTASWWYFYVRIIIGKVRTIFKSLIDKYR